MLPGINEIALAAIMFSAPVGLDNLGNTCFVNASLQCLLNQPELCCLAYNSQQVCHACQAAQAENPVSCCNQRLTCCFSSIIRSVCKNTQVHRSSALVNFVRHRLNLNYRVRGVQKKYVYEKVTDEHNQTKITKIQKEVVNFINPQEDAAEFLTRFFNTIRQENPEPSELNHAIHSQFYLGQFSTIICSECGYLRQSDIEHHAVTIIPITYLNNLEGCLQNEFCNPEQITNFTCPSPTCQRKETTTKIFYLSNTPRCLILNLNRSSFDAKTKTKGKDCHTIIIPYQINISPYLSLPEGTNITPQQTNYHLNGIIMHTGPTLENGHYTTYVKKRDGQWYHCNDATLERNTTSNRWIIINTGIRKATNQEIDNVLNGTCTRHGEPYILFYEQAQAASEHQAAKEHAAPAPAAPDTDSESDDNTQKGTSDAGHKRTKPNKNVTPVAKRARTGSSDEPDESNEK